MKDTLLKELLESAFYRVTTVTSKKAPISDAPTAGACVPNVRIVLCQTSHPGNIGASARAMQTMGLTDLALVNPLRFPHPEATAMASNATAVLEQADVCSSLPEALRNCAWCVGMSARRRQLSHPPIPLQEAVTQAVQIAREQKVAFVFGTEMSGLSNAELLECQQLSFIPTAPQNSSLNLAAAVQIVAYELHLASMTASNGNVQATRFATHEEVTLLYAHLEQALIKMQFLNPVAPKRLMPRLKRLFSRTRIEKEEVDILRGVCKQIVLLADRAGDRPRQDS